MTALGDPTDRLAGERVLLIGGAGFIGHHLALALGRAGVAVMVVDNLMVNSLVDNVFADGSDALRRELYLGFLLERYRLMREAGVELRNADARQMVDLARAFEAFQPTKVVHLAAIASALEARRDPGLCFDLQLVTLRNALELCRVRAAAVNQLVLMSSSTVYGDFATESVDESTRPSPRGIYANTKYMAERLVRTYNHQHGLGTTIVRPSALYGERCVSRRVSQVFIENALRGRPLPLEGGGAGRLDFTYIEDLVEGLVRALAFHGGADSSETFNLTYGDARTIAELARIVCEVVPGARVEECPRAEDKPVRGTLATRRAEEVLGFKARWPLEEGYRRYCAWYAEEWRAATRRMGRG
ncbi:MAG: NAD(P)-dependent oxidoreductase [Alphaproteobacteria bacterium]